MRLLASCLASVTAVSLLACGGSADDATTSAADLSADHRHKKDAGAPANDAGPDASSDAGTGSTDSGTADDDTCDESTFTFLYEGAQQVWVAGTFTTPVWGGANAGALPMTQVAANLWTLRAQFPTRARHLYKFIVDDQPGWYADPLNPESEPDGTGLGNNSVVNHFQVFVYPQCPGSAVDVTGTFTSPAWTPTPAPPFNALTGGYVAQGYELPSGTSLYKFIVGTNPLWAADPYNPETVPDGYGGQNSVVHVCHE